MTDVKIEKGHVTLKRNHPPLSLHGLFCIKTHFFTVRLLSLPGSTCEINFYLYITEKSQCKLFLRNCGKVVDEL